ncbi:MAG: DUF4340 domain-containing protein [Spirochaetaceae bacterium]|jgi:hypothetical protein|nr:DUF4340 domain-containing protein [Spirochaetaceae bacterium]
MADKYNKRIAILSGILGVLALTYTATLVLDPETVNARNALFTWLDKKYADQADRIELSGADGMTTLVRHNDVWFVSRNDTEYPAKQDRIKDFLKILTGKGRYPVRGTAAASLERFGLAEKTASRAVIRGGGSAALLDLLVGDSDSAGREVYLRKNGENEVRSGEDKLSSYIDSPTPAWLDLRLFPESLSAESVQRVTVYSLEGPGGPPQVLTREGATWTITGIQNPDPQRVESYIRSILEAVGEDFLDENVPDLPPEPAGIALELGNGQTRRISVGPLLESNRRMAEVAGSSFKYLLAEWTVNRLFRNDSYFERQ